VPQVDFRCFRVLEKVVQRRKKHFFEEQVMKVRVLGDRDAKQQAVGKFAERVTTEPVTLSSRSGRMGGLANDGPRVDKQQPITATSAAFDALKDKVLQFLTAEPISGRSDVRGIIDGTSKHFEKGTFDFFTFITIRWLIREPSMLAAFDEGPRSFTGSGYIIDHCFAQVAKLSDTMTLQHIPRRSYNFHFKPSMIIYTWGRTLTRVVALALVAYFNEGAPFEGMEGILKVINKNMHGAGLEYGAPNLLRICFLAMGIRTPDGPDGCWFEMSKGLAPVWNWLRDDYKITNCLEFNKAFGTDLDSGAISYVACMFLKERCPSTTPRNKKNNKKRKAQRA
jgi:hypothetical protein